MAAYCEFYTPSLLTHDCNVIFRCEHLTHECRLSEVIIFFETVLLALINCFCQFTGHDRERMFLNADKNTLLN